MAASVPASQHTRSTTYEATLPFKFDFNLSLCSLGHIEDSLHRQNTFPSSQNFLAPYTTAMTMFVINFPNKNIFPSHI